MGRGWEKEGAFRAALKIVEGGKRKTLNVDECREELRKVNWECSREEVNYHIISRLQGWRIYIESDDGNNTFYLYNKNCSL